MPIPFGRKLIVVAAVALLSLAAVTFIGVESSHTLADSSAWVAHTHETLSELSGAAAVVQEAENAAYAYIITRDRANVAPISTATWKFSERIRNLERLLRDDRRQMQRLRLLHRMGEARIATISEAVGTRSIGSHARRQRSSGSGLLGSASREQARRMRSIVLEMSHEERQRLNERSQHWSGRIRQAAAVFAFLLALNVAMAVALRQMYRRELQQRARAIESAERLGSIVESSRDAIFVVSPEGEITSWNAGAEELFGYGADEILGQSVRVLAPPDTENEDISALERARHASEPEAYEAVRVARDGRRLEVALIVSPVRDAGDAFTGASVIVRDIRPHREAERALRESQARFRIATDAMEEGLMLQDATGAIRLCNRRAGEILGLSPDQLSGRSALDLRWRAVRPDGAPLGPDEHPTMLALRTGRAVHEEVIGLYRPEGSVVWISMNAVPIFNGREPGVVATFSDVTERRSWRSALMESEQRFRSAIDHAPIGIGLMQPNGRWYRINEALCRMLGCSAEELISIPFRRFMKREDLRNIVALHRRLRNGEIDAYQAEPRLILSPEREIWALVSVSAVRGADGLPQDLIVQAQDITDRKVYEESATQHLMALSEAHAELAMREHELRDANQRLESLATEDALTGLKNYRHFRERLADEFQRARRYNHSLSIILMDVDRFKLFNDTYGHLAGDAVLASVGALLKESVRETDVVARYGGEEFVMILPYTEGADALATAQRLRSAIEATGIYGPGITASFGVAAAVPGMQDANALIAASDTALYESKALGRNRVTLWRSPSAVALT